MFALFLVSLLLCLLQYLAALPWLAAFDAKLVRSLLRRPAWLGWTALSLLASGLVVAVVFNHYSDRDVLARLGRIYASVLHLQLAADFFVFVFAGLLIVSPKGAAVAFAAFRESLRQPMFWLLLICALFLMWLIPLLPYFTLGEDFKMVKELGYDWIMFIVAIFAVIAASMSISEEIEGRTAITLMSKPVSRRHFLLGKFGGILLAALVMTVLLGWSLVWMLIFKQWWDPGFYQVEAIPDPQWVIQWVNLYAPEGESAFVLHGVLLWVDSAGDALPKLVIVFCQIMVLLSIATALATRLPMIVNVPIVIVFYLLGHLAPILAAVSQNRYRLVSFMAQVFDTILPGLEHFHLGAAIVRDTDVPPVDFALYAVNVSVYALVYTAIALLVGLILFEDRDLA